jgi:hypothetical protein
MSRDEAQYLERLAAIAIEMDLPDGPVDHCLMNAVSPHNFTPPFNVDREAVRQANEALRLVVPLQTHVFGPIGIFVESGWAHEPWGVVQNQSIDLRLAGRRYRIAGFPTPLPQVAYVRDNRVLVGVGVQLSPVGSEIVGLIRVEPNEEYVRLLGQALAVIGLKLLAA